MKIIESKTSIEICQIGFEEATPKYANKRWVEVDDLLKWLRTIEGGHMKSRPEYTMAAIEALIKEMEE